MPNLIRPHDVRGLTAGEIQRTRRELRASLALVRPDSPARVPILSLMSAIDTELAERRALDREQMIYLCSCGFGTDDQDWFEDHAGSAGPGRGCPAR